MATIYNKLFTDKQLKDRKDKWLNIGLATGPTDWDKAELGIKLAYKATGLKAPKHFIKCQSPLQGAIAAAELNSEDSVSDQVRNQVWNQVRNQVWNQVRTQVWDQVWCQVRNQVRRQVWNQVRDQVSDQVWFQVWNQVLGQVRDQVWHQVRNQVCFCQHDAHWLSELTTFNKIPEVKKLEGLVLLAESTGWFWPFKDTVIFTERPSQIIWREDKAIHIEYPDGFTVSKLAALEQLAAQSL